MLKKISGLILSTKTTLVLLLVFAVSIGTATIIEEKYDTVTARLLIYNTHWFEVVMLLLALNFIGNIQRFKLLRKEKLAPLVFHLAFILLIAGAGYTRYIGFEGMMHIREGHSSDIIWSADPYLQVNVTSKGETKSYERKMFLSENTRNSFHVKMDGGSLGEIRVDYRDYMANAMQKINEHVPGGVNILQLMLANKGGRQTILIKDGEVLDYGQASISFNSPGKLNSIRVVEKDGKLFMHSRSGIIRTIMHGMDAGKDSVITLPLSDTIKELNPGFLYQTQDLMLMYVRLFVKAKEELIRGSAEDKGAEALLVDVTCKGKTQLVPVFCGSNDDPGFRTVKLEGGEMQIACGPKAMRLPFSIRLDDFILDRYAGSMSPSSFASQVTLSDLRKNLEQKHRIYMNHVLDYNGYRFFQSSYDMDEQGTILSVNHDFWGTWISYAGYILLGVGFVFTLLSRNSRFQTVRRSIREVRLKRRAAQILMLIFFISGTSAAFSQSEVRKPVSAAHADKFGHLLVQTFDGRFEPMHTMACDVMHKLSRKDDFRTDQKGAMTGMQVFMDIILDAPYWKQQKIIMVREKSVQKMLGIDGNYASFNDFLDSHSAYKLREAVEKAFRKKPAEQNVFDKEVIKVDERVNVMLTILNGNLVKTFPLPGAPDHKWISFVDSLAYRPLIQPVNITSADLRSDVVTYNIIMQRYLMSVYEATASGDYSKADRILAGMDEIQRNGTPENLLPSRSMVNVEIRYNKAGIFDLLKNVYGLLSILLLIFAFIDNLRTKKSRIITWLLWFFIAVLFAAFLYHTYGMGLRWYLTGHAPWSNGYETLLLVGWASLLAGFCFMRYSKITIAATALLAFSVLMTAGHSSYDPQLTNLQPVLKSYWLIIHVAVITISYGFLALGFILGLINLFIYLFKTDGNKLKLSLVIEELTLTNEMALSVGIVMATLGTFLGGIWASESWGRYWGWDSKETWALIIVITYAIVLHLRFVPKTRGNLVFNIASVVGFGSVIMTFVGVNYYFSKGLHSYAADDTPVFPWWGWMMICSLLALVLLAFFRERSVEKK